MAWTSSWQNRRKQDEAIIRPEEGRREQPALSCKIERSSDQSYDPGPVCRALSSAWCGETWAKCSSCDSRTLRWLGRSSSPRCDVKWVNHWLLKWKVNHRSGCEEPFPEQNWIQTGCLPGKEDMTIHVYLQIPHIDGSGCKVALGDKCGVKALNFRWADLQQNPK